MLGIVGLSGSGKSTLLRAIVGILDDHVGTIALRGEQLARRAVERPRALRRQVQIVFQDPASSLNPRHTVSQIIARAVRLFREDVPRDKTAEAVAELLESVKLSRSFCSAIRPSSPAASSSAWPSPAPSRRARACCSATR